MSPASYQTAPPRGAAAKVAHGGQAWQWTNGVLRAGCRGGGWGAVAFGGEGSPDQAAHGVDAALVLGEVAVGESLLGGPVFGVGLAEEVLDGLVAAWGWRRGLGAAVFGGGFGVLVADDLRDGLGE